MPACKVASVMSDSVCPMDCSPPDFSVHGILPARIWCGLPCLPSRDLPNPGTEPMFPESSTLAGGFFTAVPSGKPQATVDEVAEELDLT